MQAFCDAGCRYLPPEDIFFAYPGDSKQRAEWLAMGQDPDALVRNYTWTLDESIKDRPDDW